MAESSGDGSTGGKRGKKGEGPSIPPRQAQTPSRSGKNATGREGFRGSGGKKKGRRNRKRR